MPSPVERPPTLRETQQWLGSQIVRSPGPLARDLIAAPPRGEIRERLDVYINGYPARAHDALDESFPALVHLIGHEATHDLVARYLPALTVRSYNLNDLGTELPSFLRTDCLTERFPFLPDLAELEWKVARAFHARDDVPFAPSRLAAWTEEQWANAVVRFQPSVAVVCSPWPILTLWNARETPISAIDIDLTDHAEPVLIRRVGFGVRCEPIDVNEARLLSGLIAGRRLGEAMAELAEANDETGDVSSWFARWVRQHLLSDFTITIRESHAR
ncbi:MAG TPA: putative DNA-binding domain-containing protein [Candidatus Binatia bacterium]|nr:putative DNA-binding domain-containing protein [Candidatus Binatia bacterium]